MTMRVLLVQQQNEALRVLTRYFDERGDETWHTGQLDEALSLLDLINPDLLVFDLHFEDERWRSVLQQALHSHPERKVIITNHHPDLQRELIAQNLGAHVFLRQPFSRKWLDRAMLRLNAHTAPEADEMSAEGKRPKGKPFTGIPLVWKVFFPYLFIILLGAVLAVVLAYRLLGTTHLEQTQTSALTARDSLQYMTAGEETELALVVNALIGRDGFAEAVAAHDADSLGEMLQTWLPPGEYEDIQILDRRGDSIVSVRVDPETAPAAIDLVSGDSSFRNVEFIRPVLVNPAGAQTRWISGLVRSSQDDFYYVGRSIFFEETFQGLLFVGRSLESLGAEYAEALDSELTIYDTSGWLIQSTRPLDASDLTMPYSQVKAVIAGSADSVGENQAREMYLDGKPYLELFIPWNTSDGDSIALFGILRPYRTAWDMPPFYSNGFILSVAGCLVLAFLAAWWVTRHVTRTLEQYGQAIEEVAHGNLEAKLYNASRDELGVLSRQVNGMVTGLQARLLEHDLLGVSYAFDPDRPLDSFTLRHLQQDGRSLKLAVLRIQPVDFSACQAVLGRRIAVETLNAFYDRLMTTATEYGGIVTHFDGEALLLYFGLFSGPADAPNCAYQAGLVAKKMREAARNFNRDRSENGQPVMHFSAALDFDEFTAGVLRLGDRLHYVVSGEALERIAAMCNLQTEEAGHRILAGAAAVEILSAFPREFEFSPIELEGAEKITLSCQTYRMC